MALSFRPLRREDLGLLSRWLGLPHVHEWWLEDADPAAVEARYGPGIDGDDPTEYFVVQRDGVDVGFVQRYLTRDNPDWVAALAPTGAPLDAAGMDYFVAAPALVGQGLGTAMLAAFVAALWHRYPDIRHVVVDVDPQNPASWRTLERLGFRRVWEGDLVTDDPIDAGPAYVYVLERPTVSSAQAR